MVPNVPVYSRRHSNFMPHTGSLHVVRVDFLFKVTSKFVVWCFLMHLLVKLKVCISHFLCVHATVLPLGRRLTSLWTSSCTSRTVQRRLFRPARPAARPYPAMRARRTPVAAAASRGTLRCPTRARPPATRAPSRSSAPSIYSATTRCRTPPGNTEREAQGSSIRCRDRGVLMRSSADKLFSVFEMSL